MDQSGGKREVMSQMKGIKWAEDKRKLHTNAAGHAKERTGGGAAAGWTDSSYLRLANLTVLRIQFVAS